MAYTYPKTTCNIDPAYVLRVPSPSACFDIPVHPVNQNVQIVKDYIDSANSNKNDAWKGYGNGKYALMLKPNETQADGIRREMREGWSDGCKLINNAREQVLNVALNAPASRRLRQSHGHVTGFNPSVPALMRGEPTAFSQWERKPKMQAVKLLCELVASSGEDASSLVWRGAATLVIADLLIEAGYSVEIWATNTVAMNGVVSCTAALVKAADEAPIPDLLASVLVSPRFYRTALLPSPRAFGTEVDWGYGQCRELDPEHLRGTDLADLCDGIYVAGCFNIDDAVKQINKVTAQINGTK